MEWKEEHRTRQNSRKGSWEWYRRRGGVLYIAAIILGSVLGTLGLVSFLLCVLEIVAPEMISPEDMFPWNYLSILFRSFAHYS